jgi:4-hydroxy-tetrahydrodipicolinate synthase
MPHSGPADLRGLLTAILTPFDQQGDLCLDVMGDLLEFQRQKGIDGVVVAGTNGEGTSLSVDERKKVLEYVMEHRGSLKVVAGTGSCSTTDAIELTKHAAEVGALAALVLPPFFIKNPSARGVADYFLRIMDSVDIPILLYSIPQMTAVPITDEIIEPLLDHPNFVGLKDSAGNADRTRELINKYPQLAIFPGSDYLALLGWSSGAAGCISGGANAFPEVVAGVRDAVDAAVAGPLAQAAQARLTALAGITTRYPLMASSKSVLAHRGLPRMGVRPPLVNLSPELEAQFLAELKEGGFIE